MNRETVVYTYKEILFRLTKEGNLATCDNMGEPWVCCANCKKSVTEEPFYIYKVSKIVHVWKSGSISENQSM